MKRFISLILTVAVLLALCPTISNAEENYGENIALKKTVWTNTFAVGYDKLNATDGDINSTVAVGGTISDHGAVGNFNKQYVAVDLGYEYNLNRVIMRTRRDIDYTWCRKGFTLWVASKSDLSDAKIVGKKETAGEYASDLNMRLSECFARYIIVTNTDDSFSIGEIEAYGEKYVPTPNGTYSDIIETKYVNAVRLVSNLNIMNGVSLGTFGADNLVTRAEASQIISALAEASEDKYNSEFADVDEKNPYAGWIAAGVANGFISKSEKFRPDEYITINEFLTMILKANGYYAFATQKGSWPDNIINAALILKINKNISVNDDFLSRKNVALILYNTLLAPVLDSIFNGTVFTYTESDNAFLQERFGKILARGVVTATCVSSLTKESTYRNGYVEIGGKEYFDKTDHSADMLGKAVYYLSDDDDKDIYCIWVDNNKTNVVEILDDDIHSASLSEISVYKNDKTIKYKLSDDVFVLKNGVAFADVSIKSLVPINGRLVLVDYNGDDVYEVLEILQPEIVVVDSADYDSDAKKLLLSRINGDNLELNYERLKAFDARGSEFDVASISSGMLVYAYISESKKNVKLEISNGKIIGTVTSFDEDYIEIDGNKHKISAYFKAQIEDESLTVGYEETFVIDNFGRAVYMSNREAASSGECLALIRKSCLDKNDNKIYFDIYNESGKFRILAASNKLYVDGKKCDNDTYNNFGEDYFRGGVAYVKINADDLIKEIRTKKSDVLTKREENLAGARVGVAGYYKDQKLVLPRSDDTVLFAVPVDNDGYPITDVEYNTLYSVSTLSKRYPMFRNEISSSINITLYGYYENSLPIAALDNTTYDTEMSGYGSITTYLDMDALVFNSYSVCIDKNDGMVYKLKGYDIVTGAVKSVTAKFGLIKAVNTFKMHDIDLFNDVPEDKKPQSDWFDATRIVQSNKINEYFVMPIENLKFGDIVRYSNRGSVSGISQLELVGMSEKFKSMGVGIFYSVGDLPDTIFSTFRLQLATIIDYKNGRISYTGVGVDNENLEVKYFRGKIMVIEDDDISNYQIGTAGNYVNSGDKIVILSREGYHESIIVYK